MNTYFSAPSHRPYYAIMVISSVTDLRSRSRYANQIAQTNLYYNICLPADTAALTAVRRLQDLQSNNVTLC